MTYVSDPFDTPEPPCFCGQQGPADQVCTTREFCPACGDPDKPAPEPPADSLDVPDDAPCQCAYCGDARAGLWP